MNLFFLACGCLFGAAVTILFQLAEPDQAPENVYTDGTGCDGPLDVTVRDGEFVDGGRS